MSNTQTAVAAADQVVVVDELVDSGVYGNYQLDQIRISRTNRKRFNQPALLELAANIKDVGVVQPILIRPVTPTVAEPQKYEIVAGERRYRGSIIAGLDTIPGVLRVLTDKQAREIQIFENLQREDPHPMEEAEGFQELMLEGGYNADQLADKLHKSRSYIYGRLKLCALTLDVREKFLNDEIPASTALLIARIPLPILQIQALKEILQPSGFPPEPMSVRKAAAHIEVHYTLDLGTAKFPLSDSKLVESAGACSKCPKKTGNQPEVFADIKNADVCTDPGCFAEKREAHAARIVAHATKVGVPVFDGADGFNKLHLARCSADSEFSALDTPIWKFARNAPVTQNSGQVDTYLTDADLPEPKAYAKDKKGNAVALYDHADIQSALEKVAACETPDQQAARLASQTPTAAKLAQTERKQKEADDHAKLLQEAADQTALRVALYKQMRRRDGDGPSLELLRAATKYALNNLTLPDDLLGDSYSFDTSNEASIRAHIDGAAFPDVLQILIDMALSDILSVGHWNIKNMASHADNEFAALTDLARSTGIDIEQVRKSLIPEMPPALPASAALDYTTETALANFIGENPDRINELATTVMTHARVELIGMLERAAKFHDYSYGTNGFTKAQSPAAANVVEDQESAVEADSDADDLAGQMAEEDTTPRATKPRAASTSAGKATTAPVKKPAATTKKAASKGKAKSKAKPAQTGKKSTPAKKASATKPAPAAVAPAANSKSVEPVKSWPFPTKQTEAV